MQPSGNRSQNKKTNIVLPLLAFLLPCLGGLFYTTLPSWKMGLVGTVLLFFTYRLNNLAARYPHAFRGKILSLAGFGISLALSCQAFGDMAYDIVWHKAFGLNKGWTSHENAQEKWRVKIPSGWISQKEGSPETGISTIFRPDKRGLSLYFYVTVLPQKGEIKTGETLAKEFLLRLGENKSLQVIENNPIVYPTGQAAHRLVYREETNNLIKESRVILLPTDHRLFLLNAGGATSYFDRFGQDLEPFLLGLEQI